MHGSIIFLQITVCMAMKQKMSLIMVCPEKGWIFIVLYQAHIPCGVTHMKCYIQLKTNQYTQALN